MARKKPKGGKKQKVKGRPASPAAAAAGRVKSDATLKLSVPPEFTAWLQGSKASVALAARKPGRLFLLGILPDGLLSITREVLPEITALCGTGQSLYAGTTHQLFRFQNALAEGQEQGGYDRLYVSRVIWTTGELGISDLGIGADGRVIFASSRLGCLAGVSEERGFNPLWKPKFLQRLGADDRCHLTGFALENGKLRYVTAAAESDEPGGWVKKVRDGGIVLDAASREVIARGLCLPRSPRIYKGVLWLLNSGTGEFGRLDPASGRFEAVALCAGYPRSVDFIADHALVAVSLQRPDAKLLASLPLAENLRKAGLTAGCGVQVIDLKSGTTRFAVQIQGRIRELAGIAALPDVRRPKAVALIPSVARPAAGS